jgi:glycosyltransferase involved in cell wall biosynthesis
MRRGLFKRPSNQNPSDQDPHVLYVSHTGVVGGGELALLDHLRAMPTTVRTSAVICPPGELADQLRDNGVTVIPFRGTTASFRFRMRDIAHIAADAVASAVAIRHATHATDVTVIHANSIRAGLLAHLATIAGGPPVIVHIHDILPDGRLSRLVRGVILRRAGGLIAVSPSTRNAFLEGHAVPEVPFNVMLNPIDAGGVLENAPERSVARERLGLAADSAVLGLVGQITPWKGQDTAIRAVARVLAANPAVRLLIVGEPRFVESSTRFANQAFMMEILELTESLGLEDAVRFLGHRRDVPTIMRSLDLLLLPSWTEPLSRAMLEAMILGIPVLATNRGGPADIIVDGESGYLAAPRDDELWAHRITAILADDHGRAAVAQRARENILQLLDLDTYVKETLALYERVEGHAAAAPGSLGEVA